MVSTKSIPEVLKLSLTSEQVRAARALLRWEQRDLAEASGVSLPSVKRLETQPGALAAQERTMVEGRAFVFGSHSARFDRNKATAKRIMLNGRNALTVSRAAVHAMQKALEK